MTFWSQSECLHEWFTTIIINNNREEGIKHCTWKGQRNWIYRIQDSSVIYYNVKAINGKDGMECFFCVLIISMTSQTHYWLIIAINDYRKRDICSGLIGHLACLQTLPFGPFNFHITPYCFHQFIIGQLFKL